MSRLTLSVRRGALSDSGQLLLRCVTLVELALLVFTAALFNISLALLVTTLYTPVALSARPYRYAAGLTASLLSGVQSGVVHLLLLYSSSI